MLLSDALSRRSLLMSGAALALPALAAPALRVAVIDVAPFGQATTDGRVTGLLSERLQALSARTGIALTPVLLPYRRASRAVATGEADLSATLDNPWMPPDAVTLGTLMSLRIVAWARPGLCLTRPADLQGLRVASLRGLRHELGPVPLRAGQEILTHRPEQLAGLARAGRIDAMVGAVETLTHIAQAAGCAADPARCGLSLGRQPVRLLARADLPPHAADALARALSASGPAGPGPGHAKFFV